MGSHISKANLIQAATFEVSSSRELTPGDSKTFNMVKSVKVLDVNTRPSDDLYHVYITYFETGTNDQVAKVFFIDMLDTSTAKIFALSKQNVYGAITRTLSEVQSSEDYYLYGGRTNFLYASDLQFLDLDWTSTDASYGYFVSYSDADHCRSNTEEEELDYGVSKAVAFTGAIVQAQNLREYTEDFSIKTPPNTLNIGDRDDEDYEDNLLKQGKIDSDGFPIESQDW